MTRIYAAFMDWAYANGWYLCMIHGGWQDGSGECGK
jgi:hypothetical protein